MKIKETIERECCQSQDLKTCNGLGKDKHIVFCVFCIHCGQIWGQGSYIDPAGSRAYELVKMIPVYQP